MATWSCMSLRSWAGIISVKVQQGLHAGEGTVHFLLLCILDGSPGEDPGSLELFQLPPCPSVAVLPLEKWENGGKKVLKKKKKVTVPHKTLAGLMENKHQMLNSMGLSFPKLFFSLLLFYQDIYKSPQRVEDIYLEMDIRRELSWVGDKFFLWPCQYT